MSAQEQRSRLERRAKKDFIMDWLSVTVAVSKRNHDGLLAVKGCNSRAARERKFPAKSRFIDVVSDAAEGR
jgi:hypothetical protein